MEVYQTPTKTNTYPFIFVKWTKIAYVCNKNIFMNYLIGSLSNGYYDPWNWTNWIIFPSLQWKD